MPDSNETHALQTVTLHTIVNNVPQAIQRLLAIGQHLFCLPDCACHTKAESASVVYFDFQDLIFNGFMVGLKKPFLLLGNGKVTVVEHNGILRLA